MSEKIEGRIRDLATMMRQELSIHDHPDIAEEFFRDMLSLIHDEALENAATYFNCLFPQTNLSTTIRGMRLSPPQEVKK